MHHRNIAYLIADGAGGRIVVWDRDAGAYHTRCFIHDGPDPSLLGHHPSPGFESGAHPRRGLADRDAVRKKVRAAVAVVLAEHVRHFMADNPVEGFILAAPVRLLNSLRAELRDGPPILGALAKNLTGVADHDLGQWLVKAELFAPA